MQTPTADAYLQSGSRVAYMSDAEFDALPYYSDVESPSAASLRRGAPPRPRVYSSTHRLLDGDSISTLDSAINWFSSLSSIRPAPPPGFSLTPHHVMSFDTPSMLALNPNNYTRGPFGTTEIDFAVESPEEDDSYSLHIGDGLPPRDLLRQSIARLQNGQRRSWLITPGRPDGRDALQTYLENLRAEPSVSMRGGAGSEHEMED
jgi:hypothetical protein